MFFIPIFHFLSQERFCIGRVRPIVDNLRPKDTGLSPQRWVPVTLVKKTEESHNTIRLLFAFEKGLKVYPLCLLRIWLILHCIAFSFMPLCSSVLAPLMLAVGGTAFGTAHPFRGGN
jgi:hypothetical protein